jgi:hypothetical protein
MKPKIKSNKWYGRFWPPERRKVKIMQAILDSKMPEIQEQVYEAWKMGVVFGLTEEEAIKWVMEHKK